MSGRAKRFRIRRPHGRGGQWKTVTVHWHEDAALAELEAMKLDRSKAGLHYFDRLRIVTGSVVLVDWRRDGKTTPATPPSIAERVAELERKVETLLPDVR